MRDDHGSYRDLQRTYGGKYIALDGATVVASGETYAELIVSVERRGLDRARLVFAYIEPADALRAYPLSARSSTGAGDKIFCAGADLRSAFSGGNEACIYSSAVDRSFIGS